MSNFKLMVSSPQPMDGTSVYRCWGTLPYLRKYGVTLEKHSDSVGWHELLNCDAVFIQRPFVSGQVELARFAKVYNKPIWIDYDDDLTCVTRDNPAYRVYGNDNTKNVIENVKTLCKIADVVSVSTETLRERLSPHSNKVVVIPNGINTSIVTPMSPDIPRNKCVVWRGSASHDRDIEVHAESILEAYSAFPEWGWCFFGCDPWRVTERMDPARCRVVPFMENYVNFMNNLQKMRGAINVVPLADTPFNHAKSRISQLEASFAGSVSVVPSWQEWQGGASFKYDGPLGFKDALFRAMSTSMEHLQEMNINDFEWVSQNRTLDKVNLLRLDIINEFKARVS